VRPWTTAQKLQFVRETYLPGRAVSAVAHAHDLNTNLLFTWRKQYWEDVLSAAEDGPFLPVQVVSESEASDRNVSMPSPKWPAAREARPGVIRVELRRGNVSIEGSVDPTMLRAALRKPVPSTVSTA
jgi:transposase